MTTQIVRLSELRYAWPGQQRAVLEISSFNVVQGERLFIRGPSGSGKSTLLGLIAGVIAPQFGEVDVLGQSLSGKSAAVRDTFRADHFGIIFQQFNLIPYLSVTENVTLPCQFSEVRRKRALSRGENVSQEALRLLSHLEMAADEVLNKPVTELSVGQQQRVAAARALIGSPEILVADEPTSSMDADLRTTFIELLMNECDEAGSTLLFVSHDAGLQESFTRAIELNELKQPRVNT